LQRPGESQTDATPGHTKAKAKPLQRAARSPARARLPDQRLTVNQTSTAPQKQGLIDKSI
jgi:hypothetical protein